MKVTLVRRLPPVSHAERTSITLTFLAVPCVAVCNRLWRVRPCATEGMGTNEYEWHCHCSLNAALVGIACRLASNTARVQTTSNEETMKLWLRKDVVGEDPREWMYGWMTNRLKGGRSVGCQHRLCYQVQRLLYDGQRLRNEASIPLSLAIVERMLFKPAAKSEHFATTARPQV